MRIQGIFFLALISLLGCKDSLQSLQPDEKIVSIDRNVVTGEHGGTLTLSAGPNDRTYYLFRHAEKDSIPKTNPVLNAIGYERSYKLAEIFRRTKVDKLYSTMYNRTMHTVDSLATAKGIATNVYTPGKMKATAEEILTTETDQNFVIVGHSNTIPGMVNLLMGRQVLTQAITEDTYDDFFVVELVEGKEPMLHQLKY